MRNNNILKVILYPISLLYGLVVWFRIFLYEKGLLKGYHFDIPIIKIGNLSLGGTGKSPMVIYINNILHQHFKTAILSRGYKRKTKGLRFVDVRSKVKEVGDEPLMFKRKFPQTTVAVRESRAEAIPEILAKKSSLECFILDDAFQHLPIENGLNVLLSTYEKPFYDDEILPSGNLRELKTAYKRADLIVVTKCKNDLQLIEKQEIIKKINPLNNQKVFFSYLKYGLPYFIGNPNHRVNLQENFHVLLLAGIADTDPLEKYVLNKVEAVYRQYYEDHHHFTAEDLKTIAASFKNIETKNKLILTTEKDAVKLMEFKNEIVNHQLPIFILPVKHTFFKEDKSNFDNEIINFVNGYLHKDLNPPNNLSNINIA